MLAKYLPCTSKVSPFTLDVELVFIFSRTTKRWFSLTPSSGVSTKPYVQVGQYMIVRNTLCDKCPRLSFLLEGRIINAKKQWRFRLQAPRLLWKLSPRLWVPAAPASHAPETRAVDADFVFPICHLPPPSSRTMQRRSASRRTAERSPRTTLHLSCVKAAFYFVSSVDLLSSFDLFLFSATLHPPPTQREW